MDGYPQWDTIFEFDYFISTLRLTQFSKSLLLLYFFLISCLMVFLLLFNLYFTICVAERLVNFSKFYL